MQVLHPGRKTVTVREGPIIPVKFAGMPYTPPPSPSDDSWRLGEVNGWIRTGQFLKQGRHSRPELVYRAEDPSRQTFVLKRRFEPRRPGETPQRQPRVESEALALFCHPNVVRLVEGGYDSLEYEYVVLPYLPGTPLGRTQTFPLVRALSLFRDSCRAIDHVHDRGVVHGDLALCNVFLSPDGGVTIIDFAGSYFRDGNMLRDPRREQRSGREWNLFVRRDAARLGCVLAALLGRRSVHRPRTPIDWEEAPGVPEGLKRELRALSTLFHKANETDIDLKEVEERLSAMLDEVKRVEEAANSLTIPGGDGSMQFACAGVTSRRG